MREFFRDLKRFILDNKIVSFLFAFSTMFFLFQHYLSLAWDFQAYVINARYLFHGGSYFEVYRAPLISVLLGLFLIFGSLGEYIYIFFVSALFFFSAKKLADALCDVYFHKYLLRKEHIMMFFYLFSLNIILLKYGLIAGTELLALSFFQLFLANVILDKSSGHWLGLAFLSRYNFIIFLPFLFFNRNIKKILKNLCLFFIVCFPWIIYNFVNYGNFFASIADSYYLNIASRAHLTEPLLFSHFITAINWFLPFFVLGLIAFFLKLEKFEESKYGLLFVMAALFFLFDFYNIPFKIARYAFNLVLPISFFSTLGAVFLIGKVKSEKFAKVLIVLLVIGIVLNGVMLVRSYGLDRDHRMFREAEEKISELGLENCRVLSPHWVPLNYYHENAYFLTYGLEEAVNNNELVVVFYNEPTIDDEYCLEDLEKYSRLAETDDYLIIGKEGLTNETCVNWKGYDFKMARDSCAVLSGRFRKLEGFAKKFCGFVNFDK